jgi:hypothetical protein
MAARTPTDFEAGKSMSARIDEYNAELLARQPMLRRGMCTPEFCFAKSFDNSRLIKAPDPARTRQISIFSVASAVVLLLFMAWGLQRFSANMSGYRVESEKQIRNQLSEDNRQLRLTAAQLSQPGRIDKMARDMGYAEPQPGQMVYPAAASDASAPSLAQAVPPALAAQ